MNAIYDEYKVVEEITLESKYLDKNIVSHIKKKIESDKIGNCTKTHGFIKNISDVRIISSKICMSDGSNRFKVEYVLRSIFPKIGKKFVTNKIVSIVAHDNFTGSIVSVDDAFQIFVTNGIMSDDKKKYKFEECDCVYGIHPCDDEMMVEIEWVLFKDDQYRVTGKHVHF